MATRRRRRIRRTRSALSGTPDQHANGVVDALRHLQGEATVAASLLRKRQCTAAAVSLREALQTEGRLDTNREHARTSQVGDLDKQISTVRRQMKDIHEEFIGACVIKRGKE